MKVDAKTTIKEDLGTVFYRISLESDNIIRKFKLKYDKRIIHEGNTNILYDKAIYLETMYDKKEKVEIFSDLMILETQYDNRRKRNDITIDYLVSDERTTMRAVNKFRNSLYFLQENLNEQKKHLRKIIQDLEKIQDLKRKSSDDTTILIRPFYPDIIKESLEGFILTEFDLPSIIISKN